MRLRSFTITELLIALAIFAVVASGIIFVIIDALEAGRASKDRTIANALAQEGLEAVRSIRNRDYSELVAGTYGLAQSGNQWILSPIAEIIQNRFTREIIIENYAFNEKKITSKINWELRAGRTLKINLVSILSNWKEYIPTVPPWANPYLASSLNLPNKADALRVFVIDNIAYLTRANSKEPEFYIIDVSDPTNPIILGSLDLGDTGNDLVVVGDYAYIASNHNSQELQIINISDPSAPTLAGTYNALGNENALGVAIKDEQIYLVRARSRKNHEFFRINVSNPTNPQLLNSLDFDRNTHLKAITISGDYAFLATSEEELQIVDINEAVPLNVTGTYDLPGNQDGFSVEIIDENTILLGKANVNNGPDLYVLNVTDKTNPGEISNFEAGQTINDLAYGSNYLFAFLATRNANLEFQVVNDLLNTPSLYGSLDLAGIANGVFYSQTNDIAYIASSDNNQELIIILPEQP